MALVAYMEFYTHQLLLAYQKNKKRQIFLLEASQFAIVLSGFGPDIDIDPIAVKNIGLSDFYTLRWKIMYSAPALLSIGVYTFHSTNRLLLLLTVPTVLTNLCLSYHLVLVFLYSHYKISTKSMHHSC